jgi:pimeloyl-ACP methyl ester carboxylesterase
MHPVSGTPILFIHGAFTRAERWSPWISYFSAAGYTCIAPSLPAHDPPDPARLRELTFDDYLAAMIAVADGLDRPPIVIGHSMGGLIAQHLAAATPCAALALVSSAAPWRTGTTRQAMAYTLSYLMPVLAGRPIRANQKAARTLVLHDLSPAEQLELAPIFAYESGKAYRTMVFGGAPIAPGAVTCPVLCVNGGADRLLRPSVGEDLAAYDQAEPMRFPDRGHSLVAGSIVGTVAAGVRGWIDRQGLPPAEPSFQAGAVV